MNTKNADLAVSAFLLLLLFSLCLKSIYVVVVVAAENYVAVYGNAHKKEENERNCNGADLSAVCLSDSNLLSLELDHPDESNYSEGDAAEKQCGNEAHDLLFAGSFCDLVAVLGHYCPHNEIVNTKRYARKKPSLDPIILFHNKNLLFFDYFSDLGKVIIARLHTLVNKFPQKIQKNFHTLPSQVFLKTTFQKIAASFARILKLFDISAFM